MSTSEIKNRCRRTGGSVKVNREDISDALDRLVELDQVERDADDNVRAAADLLADDDATGP